MMIQKTIILLMCSHIALAQNDSTRATHLGFVYPLSTNGQEAKLYSNGGSFHAIAGVSGNEKAFCLSGVSNMVMHNANGFIMAGVANYIGGDATGMQLAGVCNIIRGNASGFLLAGFNNICHSTTGLQMAGFSNIIKDTGKGVQMAGFSNIAGISNTQLAGFGNIAKEMKGGQISGFANVTKKIKGAHSAGLGPSAKHVEGVQIAGFINVAQKVKGAQIAGFINIADSCDYPIGLVNIIKNGEQYIGVNIDETGTAILNFRSGSKKLYGILGAGFNMLNDDLRYGLEGGMGLHIPFRPWFRFKTEFTVLSLTNFTDGVFMKSSLRILPAVRLGHCFEIFAGPSVGFSNYPTHLGENIAPQYLWRHKSNGTFYGINIGGTAGIQVRL